MADDAPDQERRSCAPDRPALEPRSRSSGIAGSCRRPPGRIVVIAAAVVVLLAIVGAVVGDRAVQHRRRRRDAAAVDAGSRPRLRAPGRGVDHRRRPRRARPCDGTRVARPSRTSDVFTLARPVRAGDQAAAITSVEPRPSRPRPGRQTSGVNVLTLQDIVTMDGVRKAILTWNGRDVHGGRRRAARRHAVEGAVRSGSTRVVMLFGDVQVTPHRRRGPRQVTVGHRPRAHAALGADGRIRCCRRAPSPEGRRMRYETAGESHGRALVALVTGVPAGRAARPGRHRRRSGAPAARLRPRRPPGDRDATGRRRALGRAVRRDHRQPGRDHRREPGLGQLDRRDVADRRAGPRSGG